MRLSGVLRRAVNDLAVGPLLAGRFGEGDVLLQTSSPRSGSTWLGTALSVIPRSCLLFEPLQLDHVPEAREAGFEWWTYRDPETSWPEGEAFLRRVFEGRVVNPWTRKAIGVRNAWRAEKLIVKSVRANRLLPWIDRNFDLPPPVHLIRHPCAVIASQARYPWGRDIRRPEAPPLLARYPRFRAALEDADGDAQRLAARWALDQLVPLLVDAPRPWLVVTYEEALLQPRPTLERIFSSWGVEADVGRAATTLERPSRVVHASGISGLEGWKERLTDPQVSDILHTVARFGLDFYGRDPEPDYDRLRDDRLPERIRDAGR